MKKQGKSDKKTAKTRARAQTRARARARKPPETQEMSRADRAILFIETYCRVPDGMHIGQPMRLEPFQKQFIRKIFDNPHGTRRAIFSAGRKNAKTALIAMLVLVFLVGPEAVQNSQIESGAMSRDQAAKVFEYCVKIIQLSPELAALVHIVPSHKVLRGLWCNTSYRAMSADAQTAHGGSPRVVIMDELGQVVGPRSDFFDAMVTSQGAHADPLMIIISTQAATDSDLLSIIIDDALEGSDPHTVIDLYTAPKSAELMDESAWALANPALGKFLSVDSVRTQAEEAVRMPSTESRFRNLILNQRVVLANAIISPDSWKACGGVPDDLLECDEIYGGLDLSQRTDLTAFILLGIKDVQRHAHAWFWTPEATVLERAKRDRAPYDLWVKQGFITATPGMAIDYEYVARQMTDICTPLEGKLMGIAFDRHRMDFLQKEFDRLGVQLPLYKWGQGWVDMPPAIDAMEAIILNKTLHHGKNPVLTMCVANAVAVTSPVGERKMDKRKTSGRIDGAVALAMAAGLSDRMHEKQGSFDDFLNAPLVL